MWNIHGLVVFQNDKLIVERYFEGQDRERGVGDLGTVNFAAESHRLRLLGRLLGGEFILGRSRLELFKLQLKLVEQSRRPRAIKRPPQLLDLELEVGDQRFSARLLRLGTGRFSKLGFR